ncbi:hypothetical protein [Natrinema versiforme]|uniref:Uncharacterized protein n=1 Tax=Natrinema versiforme TaxID=88724 RepID=A0A4P8WII2_9EURY|nr:hypothetical protein [Natrinema versiforme]QCS42872.1 hypothetical protein FEJ81_11070 [Natrinema versiforme]
MSQSVVANDDTENPCSQGQVMDFLINQDIAEYSDPCLTLRVNSISSNDIEQLQDMGWKAEVYHDNGETLVTVHQM